MDYEESLLDIINEEVSESEEEEELEDLKEEKGKEEKKERTRRSKKKKGKVRKTPKMDKGYVERICKELKEKNSFMVYKAIDLLGVALFENYLKEVRQIQASGGQMTIAGDRRKTGGGILWKLIRQQDPDIYQEITKEIKNLQEEFAKQQK